MKFIQDNVQLRFWPLLVVVLLGLVLLTVLYEGNVELMNEKYVTKLQELDKTYAQLASSQGKLNETQEQLSLKERRESVLTKSYQELQDDVVELQGDVENLRAENTLLEEKAQIVDQLNATVENLGEDVKKWETLYRDQLDKTNQCQQSLSSSS